MLPISQIEIIILGVLAIWLFALSVFFFSYLRFFNRLVGGAKGEDLRSVLEKILVSHNKNTLGLVELDKEIRKLEEDGRLHVQKTGLIRFNPFRETGGNNSFSLAILDGTDTGLVITILHTRERSRVYAKSVKNGKGELELSSEEKKALAKAQKS